MVTKQQWAAIAAVLLLAAAMRIVNAGHWPVWTDEGASLYIAGDGSISEIMERLQGNHHPPLYFAALGAWEHVVGQSRIALRMLTILGGMLAVAVVYRLTRDWFGHTAAIYAALLFAVSDLVVQYSQQIRHYGWLTLAVALMSLLFLRALRRPTLLRWLLYALSISLMMYIHYLGLMALAVQGVVGLFVWRGSLRLKARLIGAWLLAGILYIPWLIALPQILRLLSENGLASRPLVEPTSLDTLARIVSVLADGQPALIFGVFLLALWQFRHLRGRTLPELARIYLLLAGAGLFAAMFIMNIWIKVLTPRTLVFLTPAFLAVVGYGLTLLPTHARRVLVAVAVSYTIATVDIIQPRLDYDAAANVVAQGYQPSDLVILETGYDDNAFEYEVQRALYDPVPDIIRTLPWVGSRGGIQPVVPKLQRPLSEHRRVWVIQWFQPSQVMPFLDSGGDGYRLISKTEVPVGAQYNDLFGAKYNQITVALYERPQLDIPARDFGGLLALRDALLPGWVAAGQTLHVDLWWSALKPLPLDYSVGVFLLDSSGAVVAEFNGPPSATPTSQWTPGVLMFDRHELALPAGLAPGRYRVVVNTYWYGDASHPLVVNGDILSALGTIQIGP